MIGHGASARLPRPHYRPMTADDLPRVLRIEAGGYAWPWSEGTFRDCLQASSYQCWVAELAEPAPQSPADPAARVAGYGILSVAAGEAHLLNLCVAREHRGAGLGRALLDWVLLCAEHAGAGVMFLEVRPSNHAACALYESAGFNEIGLRPGYYPAPNGTEPARVMAYQFALV